PNIRRMTMSRVIGQFSDDYGNEYVLLDDPDDDLRNAPPVRRTEPARRPAPAPRAPRAVPVQTVPASGQGAPMARVPQAQPVQILQARDAVSRDAMIAKTAKVLDFVELFTDGVAELIPLPDRPPRPTGELPVDLYNQ